MKRTKRSFSLMARVLCGIGLTTLAGLAGAPAANAIGTWTAVPSHAGDDIAGFYLLTDGSILANGYNDNGIHWYKYTPDSKGDYTKGTWSNLAVSPWGALYYVAFVLNDGRLWMAGGEYPSFPPSDPTRSNHVQMYDPATNTWMQGPNGLFGDIGDTGAVLLSDGSPFTSTRANGGTQIYDLITNTWSASGTLNAGSGDEETWIALADGSIFDCLHNPGERWIPSTGQWIDTAICPITMSTSKFGGEEGPFVYLQNGQVWCASDNGPAVRFNPPTTMNGIGSWSPSAPYPAGYTAGDTPASILPNGKVLLIASQVPADVDKGDIFGPGSCFEYDPDADVFTPVPDPPGGRPGAAFTTRFLSLPNGQVLYTDGGALAVYTEEAGTGPQDAWRPTVTSVIPNSDGSFKLTGTQITGRSFGSMYGDDFMDSTNYPIVYLKDPAGNVFYCQSSDFSTRAIWTGSTPETCKFVPPAGLPAGRYNLFVSVNGVSSKTPYPFPPAPVFSSLSPTAVGVGAPPVTITVNGQFFLSTATVTFNGGTPVAPISVTPTQLTVTAPASVVGNPGLYSVRVHDPNQVADSAAGVFVVGTPTITTITPSAVAPGSSSFWMTINGSSFTTNSKVTFAGGAPVTPASVTPTQILVAVPASVLTANASVPVVVVNTAGAGGSSPAVILSVAGAPTLTSSTPPNAGVGSTDTVLTLTGSGFNPLAKVTFNADNATVPTSVTPTQITVAVPAAVTSAVNAYAVRVQNPGTSNISGATAFRVYSPVISALNPSAIPVSATASTLTIDGKYFITGSKVTFNGGAPVTPTSATSTEIVVPLAASLIKTAGTIAVVVVNTSGAGGSSVPVNLTVSARPTLTGVSPATLPLGSANTVMTVTGTNFQAGATVSFNDTTSVAATVVSPTQLTVTAPAAAATSLGAHFLRVVNPGNTGSNSGRYDVISSAPVISVLSPDTVGAGLSSLTLYIGGTGFTSDSTVTFNGGSSVTPTSVTPTRIVVTVPGSLLASAGTVKVVVTNAGGVSAPATLTVTGRPTLTGLTPNTLSIDFKNVPVTFTGTNFTAGSVITITSAANTVDTITPTFVSSTTLKATIPVDVLSNPGAYFVRIVNPGFNTTSDPARLTILQDQ